MREQSARVPNKFAFWLCLGALAHGLAAGGAFSADVPSRMEAPPTFFRPIPDDLFGVSFADERHGWVSGYYGSVLKTTDGGGNWSYQDVGGSQLIRRIQFVDKRQGWAVGHRGSVYTSTDGGTEWTEKTLERGLYLRSLDFASPEVGWIVGHEATIFATRNGGDTWARQSLLDFKGRDLPRLNDIAAVSKDKAVAVGEFGTVAITHDGGKTWNVMPNVMSATLTAVAVTHNHFIAVGLDGSSLTGSLMPDQQEEMRVLPTNTKEHLFDIGFNERGDGFAVGRAVALEFRGAEFKPVSLATPFDRPSNWLGGVSLLADGTAYAVGNSGHILRLSSGSGQFSVIYDTAADGVYKGEAVQ